MRASVVLVLVALACAAQAQTAYLRLLSNYTKTLGARCIDGSAPGYYYVSGSGSGASSWLLFIEGGGWCYTTQECYQRSLSPLGSSSSYNATVTNEDGMTGLWSSDCSTNPTFCNWNKILLKYCDGTSFTSYLNNPIPFNGTQLYFRGRANLDAMLTDLATLRIGTGWVNAQQVVLSGCSAGGLSTYHAADHVATRLPASVKKYAALPVSGYFLLHNNDLNQPIYPMQMASIFAIANCSNGVSPACLAANPGTNAWKCMFAQNALPYIKTPIFLLNSGFDFWQLLCEYYTNATTCGAYFPSCQPSCSSQQWATLNQYGSDFVATLNATSNYHRSGNGGFIHSCVTHCEAVSPAWNTFKIGGVSMQQAVTKWWTSNGAGNNWQWDCMSYSASGSHVCNPTCGAFPDTRAAADYVSWD